MTQTVRLYKTLTEDYTPVQHFPTLKTLLNKRIYKMYLDPIESKGEDIYEHCRFKVQISFVIAEIKDLKKIEESSPFRNLWRLRRLSHTVAKLFVQRNCLVDVDSNKMEKCKLYMAFVRAVTKAFQRLCLYRVLFRYSMRTQLEVAGREVCKRKRGENTTGCKWWLKFARLKQTVAIAPLKTLC